MFTTETINIITRNLEYSGSNRLEQCFLNCVNLHFNVNWVFVIAEKNVIFPIEISKIFVGKPRRENSKTLLV